MIFTGITSLIVVAISLVEFVVLTRFYPVEVFGEYAVIALSISLVGLLGNGLFSQVYLRRNAKFMPSFLPLLPFLVGVQFLVVVVAISLLLPTFPGLLVNVMVLVCLCSNFLLSCLESSYVRRGEIRRINIFQVFAVAMGALISVGLAWSHYSDGLLVLTVSLTTKSLIVCLGLFERKIMGVRQVCRRRCVKYYLLCALTYRGYLYSSWLGYVVTNIDRWFAVSVFNAQSIAFYSRAHQFVNVPIVILNRIVAKDVQYWLISGKSVSLVISLFLIVSSVLAALLFSQGDRLIELLLGEQWTIAGEVFTVLALLIPAKLILKFIDVTVRARSNGSTYVRFYMLQLLILIAALVVSLPETAVQLSYVLVLSSYLSVMLVGLLLLSKRVWRCGGTAG